MKIKTLIGLTSLSAAGAVAAGYLLRRRPRALRYAASGAAFLLPFGVYALATKEEGESNQLSFLFVSDTHGRPDSRLTDMMLREEGIDFVVHGGDISDTEELWRAWWDTPYAQIIQRWPVFATRGNHDPEAGFRQRFPYWPPYKLNKNGVDFFFVPYTVNDSVVAWLDRETAASTAPIKILVTHRPVWPANSEGSLATKLATLLPRIDLVLAGHNHVRWDHVVGSVRQVIEVSGSKKYTCDAAAAAAGCTISSTGYTRIDIVGGRVAITRRSI